MDFSIRQIMLLAVMIIVTAGVTRYFTPPDVVYQTEHQQQQIDALSVSLQNTQLDRHRLQEELRETTQGFQQRLQAKDEQIASYTRIIGSLNLEVDSLSSIAAEVSLNDLQFVTESAPAWRDTTLTAKATFGNGLLESIARGGIRSGYLFVEPPTIRPLRPVRLGSAVTLTDDNRVTSLATSPDFTNLHVEAFTELEPPRKRWPWFWIGLGTGIVLTTVL